MAEFHLSGCLTLYALWVLAVISIVCVYNSKTILADYLLKSLQVQSVDYELILVDNTGKRHKSASEALNFGARNAMGKYLMFVHQDVDLRSSSWLDDAERMLDSVANLGIAGVAGKKDTKGVMTNSKHGNPPVLAGSLQIEKPTEVQTLDECLVIIPRSVFNKLRFDEETCSDWHLFAVDYCLSVTQFALRVYVIPMFIYHRSTGATTRSPAGLIRSLGSLPDAYYQTLAKLLRKHKSYGQIHTTGGDWDTSLPVALQRMRHAVKAVRPALGIAIGKVCK